MSGLSLHATGDYLLSASEDQVIITIILLYSDWTEFTCYRGLSAICLRGSGYYNYYTLNTEYSVMLTPRARGDNFGKPVIARGQKWFTGLSPRA